MNRKRPCFQSTNSYCPHHSTFVIITKIRRVELAAVLFKLRATWKNWTEANSGLMLVLDSHSSFIQNV